MEPEKFDPTSHTLTDDLKDQLKQLVPEAFTEQGIDFDRLKTLLGENIDVGQERYSFTWPGKTQAIRAAQTSSIGTLVPDEGSSEDWDTTGNLYLEGDNLEILKLLQKSYTGKVKMIYIDPPYNTGKDFVYPDNYGEGLKTYLEYTGQIDGEGKKITTNTEIDGRYHSKWLNMMYPRLMLARNLLNENGVIFVSIDDHEVQNLRKIMDEVFGPENFFAQLTRRAMHTVRNSSKDFNLHADYVISYAKRKSWFEADKSRYIRQTVDKTANYPFDDQDGKGPYKLDPLYARNFYTPYVHIFNNGIAWQAPEGSYPRYSEETLEEMESEGRIVFPENAEIKAKRHLKDVQEGQPPNTILSPEDVGFNSDGTRELKQVLGSDKVFSQPKPTKLVTFLASLLRDKEAVVMDFFSGSGTTAHAIMNLNIEDGGTRKYIVTQLQEPLDPSDRNQTVAVGFCNSIGKPLTIAEIGKERIRRAGAKIKVEFADQLAERETPFDSGFRTYRLSSSTFNTWDATSGDDIQAKLLEGTSIIKSDARDEDVLAELILKSGYGLSSPVTAVEIKGVTTHSVADGELLIVLSGSVSQDTVRAIAESNPKRFIARESAFGNDADLTNAAQIMKDKGIDFRVL